MLLDLSGQNVTRLDPTAEQPYDSMDISDNPIDSLGFLRFFPRLSSLKAQNCALVSLQAAKDRLPREINLRRNRIVSLAGLGAMDGVEILTLDENPFEASSERTLDGWPQKLQQITFAQTRLNPIRLALQAVHVRSNKAPVKPDSCTAGDARFQTSLEQTANPFSRRLVVELFGLEKNKNAAIRIQVFGIAGQNVCMLLTKTFRAELATSKELQLDFSIGPIARVRGAKTILVAFTALGASCAVGFDPEQLRLISLQSEATEWDGQLQHVPLRQPQTRKKPVKPGAYAQRLHDTQNIIQNPYLVTTQRSDSPPYGFDPQTSRCSGDRATDASGTSLSRKGQAEKKPAPLKPTGRGVVAGSENSVLARRQEPVLVAGQIVSFQQLPGTTWTFYESLLQVQQLVQQAMEMLRSQDYAATERRVLEAFRSISSLESPGSVILSLRPGQLRVQVEAIRVRSPRPEVFLKREGKFIVVVSSSQGARDVVQCFGPVKGASTGETQADRTKQRQTELKCKLVEEPGRYSVVLECAPQVQTPMKYQFFLCGKLLQDKMSPYIEKDALQGKEGLLAAVVIHGCEETNAGAVFVRRNGKEKRNKAEGDAALNSAQASIKRPTERSQSAIDSDSKLKLTQNSNSTLYSRMTNSVLTAVDTSKTNLFGRHSAVKTNPYADIVEDYIQQIAKLPAYDNQALNSIVDGSCHGEKTIAPVRRIVSKNKTNGTSALDRGFMTVTELGSAAAE